MGCTRLSDRSTAIRILAATGEVWVGSKIAGGEIQRLVLQLSRLQWTLSACRLTPRASGTHPLVCTAKHLAHSYLIAHGNRALQGDRGNNSSSNRGLTGPSRELEGWR